MKTEFRSPLLAMLFPGLLIGIVTARLFGITAGVLACGVSNGPAYRFLLYGWWWLAAALRGEFQVGLLPLRIPWPIVCSAVDCRALECCGSE